MQQAYDEYVTHGAAFVDVEQCLDFVKRKNEQFLRSRDIPETYEAYTYEEIHLIETPEEYLSLVLMIEEI